MRGEEYALGALAVGFLAMAAEVRRMGQERDQARREFEGLVGRLAERPTTVLTQAAPAPISSERTYISDLPYHDDVYDEFVSANETPLSPDED